MSRIALSLILALSLLPALSACGKKGDPEPPPGSEFPRTYPTR